MLTHLRVLRKLMSYCPPSCTEAIGLARQYLDNRGLLYRFLPSRTKEAWPRIPMLFLLPLVSQLTVLQLLRPSPIAQVALNPQAHQRQRNGKKNRMKVGCTHRRHLLSKILPASRLLFRCRQIPLVVIPPPRNHLKLSALQVLSGIL